MTEQTKVALDVLRTLQSVGALRDIVLIGSWCQIFYSRLFNTDELSILRTSDIDLLIPQNLKTKNDVDIGKLFEMLGFTLHYESSGLIKYDHDELEIQFLTNEKGSGKNPPVYEIKAYHVNAEGLRYVDILFENAFYFDYEDLTIKLPIPEIFILQKILISEDRQQESDSEKDLRSVIELVDLCIKDPERIIKIQSLFSRMPFNGRKKS
jgi:hypothetical protein